MVSLLDSAEEGKILERGGRFHGLGLSCMAGISNMLPLSPWALILIRNARKRQNPPEREKVSLSRDW